MTHITAKDKAAFREKGYVIKHNAVTVEQIEDARNVIWDRLDADRNDPTTWIQGGKEGSQGMDGHAALHALIYESPLYNMVEALCGKGRLAPLHPQITSTNLRFPHTGEWTGPKGPHMDGHGLGSGIVNNWTVGITLYLNDVKPHGGGTCIWPGTHKHMADYFKTHARVSLSKPFYDLPIYNGAPRSTKPLEILGWDESAYEEIHGPAGTAMIWHSHLIHSASMNCNDEIRMAIITRFRWTNWDDLKFEDPGDMWEYWEGM